MNRKNYYAIDIAKFISALFVICIHTGPLLDVNKDANFILVQILSRIAVPLFFVISGFLFFQKIDVHKPWKHHDNLQALKRYLVRIFKIYGIWTILYLPFTIWIMYFSDGNKLTAILRYIKNFFFTGSYYHLWFLPALMFAVFAVYFMVHKLTIKKTLLITFLCYVIGMLGNIYPKLLEDIPLINPLWKAYESFFTTTRNGFFFGMMFVALGAFFAKYNMHLKRPTLIVGFLISLFLLFVECFLIRNAGYMNDLVSMYVMLIPCVSFLFLSLLHIDLKERALYKTLRQMSLLVYVSHIMFVFMLTTLLPQLHSLLLYLIALAGSLVLSYGILWLSRKKPLLKSLY